MSRLRQSKLFNRRSTPSADREPERKFYFAFEGNVTEQDYFQGIKSNQRTLGISSLIELILLERENDDTLSHPMHVCSGLREALVSGEHTYDPQVDEAWIVIDRDKQSVSAGQINELKQKCSEHYFHIALSNPTFEFWLLCHFEEVMNYCRDDMLRNRRESSNHKFLSKRLTEIIPNGFSKNNLRFSEFVGRIDLAIQQSKSFETDIDRLDASLGTNVGVLLERLKTAPEIKKKNQNRI
jgi:hypothetical protein